MREEELVEKALRYFPSGSMGFPPVGEQPIIWKDGRGSKIWDVSGREYLDYVMGSGPMILGHAHPAVVAAVQERIGRASTLGDVVDGAVELAEELVRAVPCAEQVRYTTSGSEATAHAIRIARAYRKREKILKFEGGYHGMHDYGMMSVFAPTPLGFPTPTANAAGIPRGVQESVMVAPFNDLETTVSLVEQHADELAAVIVEPMQRAFPPKPGFLQGLREVTQRYQIPLIFDEVVTGFRLAYGGAQEFYGVVPELAAIGKIMGGGYAHGAVVGKAELMQMCSPGLSYVEDSVPLVHTFSGNPVSCAAGLATLKELRKPGTYEQLFGTGNALRQGMQEVLDQAEVPAQAIGEGPILEVYFTDHEVTDLRSSLNVNKELASQFNQGMVKESIFKRPPKMYVSLAHDEQDIDRTLEACKKVVKDIRG